MAYLSSRCLLPKQLLQQQLKIQLCSIIRDQVSSLQQQRPMVYQDLLAYTLSASNTPIYQRPSSTPSAHQANTSVLPNVPLYWQQLLLSDNSICSELIIMQWQSTIYIGYLSILPATFGLFSPLCPRKAMMFADELVAQTINNIIGLAKPEQCIDLVTRLINPNLAALFEQHGFLQSPQGSQIVGLPLPAYFFRLLRPV